MERMPQPIPYQGSKRNIAARILSVFPDDVQNLMEPFAGSAAISIRAAYAGKANHSHLNDLNEPLINLLEMIINTPDRIAADYEQLWKHQLATTGVKAQKSMAKDYRNLWVWSISKSMPGVPPNLRSWVNPM